MAIKHLDFVRIAVYLFLVTSSFGFLQPFVPLYMEAAGLDRFHIGLLTGAGIGIALLAQPTLGRWSDRIDARRPFICASGLMGFAAYMSFPYAKTPVTFLALVALGNVGLMYLNAAGGVLVGRIAKASSGGAAYGGLRLWGSVGYIVTSLASGVIVWRTGGGRLDRSALDPLFHFAPMLFLLIASIAWVLPDAKSAPTADVAGKAPLSNNLRLFLVAFFLYILALYGVSGFLSLFLQSLGAKGIAITGVFAAGVVVEVLVMRWSGRFSDRFGRRPALAISFLILPIRLLLYMPATGPLWVLAVQSLHGVNFGIMGAVAVVFVNDLATDRTRGHAQSRLFAVQGLGTAVGPLLFGYVAQKLSLVSMFGVAAAIAAVAGAIFMLGVEDSHHGAESLADRAPVWLRGAVRWLDQPMGKRFGADDGS